MPTTARTDADVARDEQAREHDAAEADARYAARLDNQRVAHVCDRRTDGAGSVYHVSRASCPACMDELEAEAIAHDRRATFGYPSGATTVEGAYVDQHRPA